MADDPGPEGSAVDDVPARLAADLDGGFVALVQGYERAAYAVALRLTGSHSEADDLCAEAFTRAYRALRDYPPERLGALQPKPWLATIVVNLWRNTERERARRPRTVELAPSHAPASPERGPQERAEDTDEQRHLAALLNGLP
ncbi:MAG: RNA polymerase sigma factor, partial [Acidimicrobiales bacterium]